MYCKCHNINPNCEGSYIDSPVWIKNKKTAINPINKKDNKCFQYAVKVELNHEEIKKDPQKITKIKPFIDKHNWEGLNCPLEKDDWEKSEKNNLTITLNILHAKKEKIYLAYVSTQNSNCEKQFILLKIPNTERWHYFPVKPSVLLREITTVIFLV